jgi:tRNA-specific 2-thiouridylase
MSGGVDSSVAAYLLKEQGYHVIGVTMQIWQDEQSDSSNTSGGCCGVTAVWDARKVADYLEIPYYVMNFKREFRENVIDYFIKEYSVGRTPNPCIACNRFVKWEALLSRAIAIGADAIATGHYARIQTCPNGRLAVANSAAGKKDQTYALYSLTQEQLAKTIMPIGEYHKEQVRAIAQSIALPVANKPDSQEICFVEDDDYASFVERELGAQTFPAGNFVDQNGKVLGRHKGIVHYTVGQRRRLGLAMGYPVFVSEIRAKTNEVVIGTVEQIQTTRVWFDHFCPMACEEKDFPKRVLAKIRYNHKGEYGTVVKEADGNWCCTFETPVMGAAPGQAIVFYADDCVLGGGTIVSSN